MPPQPPILPFPATTYEYIRKYSFLIKYNLTKNHEHMTRWCIILLLKFIKRASSGPRAVCLSPLIFLVNFDSSLVQFPVMHFFQLIRRVTIIENTLC